MCDSSAGEYLLIFTSVFTCYVYPLGKKKQDTLRHQRQQYSTPKAGSIATKPSAKMHSKSPSKHLTTSTPHHRQYSSTLGTVHTPRSTPTVYHTTPHSVTHHMMDDNSSPSISNEIQLRELFSILKGYVYSTIVEPLLTDSPKLRTWYLLKTNSSFNGTVVYLSEPLFDHKGSSIKRLPSCIFVYTLY